MKYTIETMSNVINGKKGYAFIDLSGHCIIIVYGENNRDLMKGLL